MDDSEKNWLEPPGLNYKTLESYLKPNGGEFFLNWDYTGGEPAIKKHFYLGQGAGGKDTAQLTLGMQESEGDKALFAAIGASSSRQASAIVDALSASARDLDCVELRVRPYGVPSNLEGADAEHFTAYDPATFLALSMNNQRLVRWPQNNEWVEFIEGPKPQMKYYKENFRTEDVKKSFDKKFSPLLGRSTVDVRGLISDYDTFNSDCLHVTAKGKGLFRKEYLADLSVPLWENQGQPRLVFRNFSEDNLASLMIASKDVVDAIPLSSDALHEASIKPRVIKLVPIDESGFNLYK